MPTSAALVFAGKSVATPAISSLVTKAFKYLNEYCKSEGMEMVRDRLEQAMPKIQAVFDVVNPERIREQSIAMDRWLWQLRDAVEEAEDAIDELEYYELEEKANDQKVSDWGSSFAKIKHKVVKSVKHVSIFDKTVKQFTRHGTLKRLRKAVDSLDKAAAGVAVFLGLTDHLNGVASSIQQQGQLVNNDRETGSTLSATTFVGREKEKEQIIGWLTKTSVESAETVTSTNSVPIISVVGHGGMGKTTLAQSICEEDEVLKHFKIIWVTVSTSFDATSVTGKILQSATGAKPSANHLEPLQQDLKEKLKFINFLLVLDDVWEDQKRDEWEKLFAPLRKVKSGSKILLTTRMRSVADMAANVMGVERDQCLTLEGLKEDENIKLFNHHVFSGLNPQNYAYLKSTGEQIAKKLGGCPLVTKVVGGHLQGNITLEYWSKFLREELEHFKGTGENIMKVLRLSYYHLPIELQICFRYCSLFPEDHAFEKKELVQMWMGSGLISLVTSGSQTLEDIGEQFLDQLTRKSFFDHKSSASIYDHIKQEYYVMHDLMHELARNVSYGECTRITDRGRFEDVKDTVRHLCIAGINSFSVEDVKKISQCKNLRTIIVDSPHKMHKMSKDIVCTLEKIVETSKSLRLFHSRLENTFHFADKFGNLRHLRYIYLHQISPEGICGVVKLYHLILLHCENGLQRQTKQVRYLGNLEQLRYVSYGVNGFGEFPITRLTSLQELKKYRVQGSIGNKISAIRDLNDLRELEVHGLGNVQNDEEARDAKLKEKQHLNSLSLDWLDRSASTGSQIRTDDFVLDHLEPHGNIRELRIFRYVGPKLPFWIENLSNMVSLTLGSCINWEHIPSLGELVLLKHLILYHLPKLQQIGRSSHMSSSSGMELSLPPSLDKLVVENCEERRELPILPPSLGKLEVISCEELRELPILPPTLVQFRISSVGLTKLPMLPPSLEKLVVENCEELRELPILPPTMVHVEIDSVGLTKLPMLPLSLDKLVVRKCEELRELPILPPSLDELVVKDCEELRELPILPPTLVRFEIYRVGLTKLPLIGNLCSKSTKSKPCQLRYISVEDCPCLTSLEESLLQQKQYMGALRSLGITDCVHLESASLQFEEMNELEDLIIGPCGELELLGLQRLTNLSHLGLHSCSGLVSLPSADVFNMGLKSLREMDIFGCENLSSLGGLGSLPSLDLLEIRMCSKLTEVGSSHQIPDASGVVNVMPSSSMQIGYLRIDLPSLLLVEPLKSLCHCRDLLIGDGSEMESLPEWWLLQNRSSLQNLEIYKAKSLESLPPSMRDLSSLKSLLLYDAGKLRFLPDLPSTLPLLHIEGCDSELGKNSGNKISRIRSAHIGDSYFIMGKECSRRTFDQIRWADDATLSSWMNESNDGQRVGAALHWLKKHFCLENTS